MGLKKTSHKLQVPSQGQNQLIVENTEIIVLSFLGFPFLKLET